MPTLNDRRVIACNVAQPSNVAPEGAKAFISQLNHGGGNDRVVVLMRSRGIRFILKWTPIERLRNFRLVTIPPAHPLYKDLRLRDCTDKDLAELQESITARHGL